MINGLITDNEISVNDVIRQVLRGNASSTTSSDGSRLSNPHDSKMTAMATTTVSSASSSTSKPSTMAPVTTNVWQQRMAARQREQQQQLAMSSSNTTKENSLPNSSTDSFSTASTVTTTTPSLLRSSSLFCTVPASAKNSSFSTGSAAPFLKSEGPSASTAVPAPIGPPSSSISFDKELPRKAPGYRSPSTQTSSSSVPVEPAIISSVASSVSSTPPPAPIGSDSSTRCKMNSPPVPIAPPPGFTSLASEVSKSTSIKATVSPLSTPSVEPPAVDVITSPLNDIATSTVSVVGKLSNTDSLTTPTGTGNDLSSMQFLDETTRAKLAEIWGTGNKQDQSSQEQAWGNQVLLNNFANLNIRSSSTDWATPSHDNLFMSSTPSKVTSVSSNHQNTSAHQTGTTFATSSSSSDWPVSSTKSMPLYARPQARIPTVPSVPSHPLSSSSSTSSTVPRQYNSSSSQPENNMLFNQLAAQLLIQQQGVASTPVPPAQSYYPSPSYTDPAIIGMGHLSTPTTGSGAGATSSVPQKSAYSNPYQVCHFVTAILFVVV
ncbi:hypothetical protein COOONC_03964 [Cooperia oncophora]